MSLPAPMIRETPFAIPIIPMVTMKAGTPVVTMIAPLTRPARAPTPTPTRIASRIGIWLIRTEPTRTVETAMMDPTERSSPPEMSTIVVPQATTPRIAEWTMMLEYVAIWRNDGAKIENTARMTRSARSCGTPGLPSIAFHPLTRADIDYDPPQSRAPFPTVPRSLMRSRGLFRRWRRGGCLPRTPFPARTRRRWLPCGARSRGCPSGGPPGSRR